MKTLTHKNRFAILWVVSQVPGVDKLEALVIKNIKTKLRAGDVEAPPDSRIANAVWDVDCLEDTERQYLLLALTDHWNAKRVPSMLSDMMLELEEMIRE